jgi:hypothetical protein
MGITNIPYLCIITEFLSRGTLCEVIYEMGDKIDQEDIRKYDISFNYIDGENE